LELKKDGNKAVLCETGGRTRKKGGKNKLRKPLNGWEGGEVKSFENNEEGQKKGKKGGPNSGKRGGSDRKLQNKKPGTGKKNAVVKKKKTKKKNKRKKKDRETIDSETQFSKEKRKPRPRKIYTWVQGTS